MRSSLRAEPLEGVTVLVFEAHIAGMLVAFIPVDVQIDADARARPRGRYVEAAPAETAFASYASADREHVMARLSALAAHDNGLKIWRDCLDLTPGDVWKAAIEREIKQRHIFFCSGHALRGSRAG